ncbi:O-antigen ligase family protein [Neobacillus vireti]|uniref:O-antigen ligase family protein n=1 Tax=Neobacillus vireti TaxID=220686 RepID=UPI003000867F
MFLESLVSIFKIVICLIYALLTLKYISIYGKDRFLKISTYTYLVFLILMILGVIAYSFGLDLGLTFAGTFRASGTFEDPNLAASYVFIMISFLMTYFSTKRNYFMFFMGIILFIVAIMLTASKGALVSLSIASISIFLLLLFLGRIKSAILQVILYGICFFILFIIYSESYLVQTIVEPIFNRWEEFTGNMAEDHSFEHRKFLWDTAFQLGMNNPLLGIGVEQFRAAASQTTGLNIWNIVHNTYLTFFSELGLVGLISFIWIWLYLILKGLKNIKLNKYLIFYLFSVFAILVSMYSISLGNFRAIWVFIAYLVYELTSIDYSKNNKVGIK